MQPMHFSLFTRRLLPLLSISLCAVFLLAGNFTGMAADAAVEVDNQSFLCHFLELHILCRIRGLGHPRFEIFGLGPDAGGSAVGLVDLHLDAAQGVRANHVVERGRVLGENVVVLFLPAVGRGVQSLRIPEAFHVDHVRVHAFGQTRTGADLASRRFDPDPVVLSDALLLGRIGIDPDFGRGHDLADVRDVAQRAVVVDRQTTVGDRERIF